MNIHIPADFTLAELRAFIEGADYEAPEGYYTAREWAAHFKIGVDGMRELLRQAKERGLLRMMKARRETIDDKSYSTPVYALQARDISDSQESTQGEDDDGSA